MSTSATFKVLIRYYWNLPFVPASISFLDALAIFLDELVYMIGHRGPAKVILSHFVHPALL